MKINYLFIAALVISFCSITGVGCQKDKYFHNSGTHEADYNGTIFQYLQNHQYNQFDSLCKVIQLAGMENVMQNENITFFAPPDTTIKSSIRQLNSHLFRIGRDTITNLSQLSSEFWKKQLSYYVFAGERRLKDYPQLDPGLLQTFPGQYYDSYQGKKMLIGVIFNNAGGVKYAGYRQLVISYFSGIIPPTGALPYANLIASSDIHPKNGIIHALQYTNIRVGTGASIRNTLYFGFNQTDFINDALQIGLSNN